MPPLKIHFSKVKWRKVKIFFVGRLRPEPRLSGSYPQFSLARAGSKKPLLVLLESIIYVDQAKGLKSFNFSKLALNLILHLLTTRRFSCIGQWRRLAEILVPFLRGFGHAWLPHFLLDAGKRRFGRSFYSFLFSHPRSPGHATYSVRISTTTH